MWKPRILPEGFKEYIMSICEPMAQAGKPGFEKDDDLRCLIRITVDFSNYLETADMISPNQHDAEFMCETIFSGIESFMYVNQNYKVLVGSMNSELKWGTTGLNVLKERFNSMYKEFLSEQIFEKKCRLLLDLFKMQIVFCGMLYD